MKTIITNAIPSITDQFDSLKDVGWYASAFFVTVGASQNMWGKAYKYYNLKTIFLAAIFVFELGNLLSGQYAHNDYDPPNTEM